MGLFDRLKQKGNELTKEQKAAFVLLVFLGLGGVVLGALSFGANIRRPFEVQLAQMAADEPYLTLSEREEKEKEAQKTRDTDSDGLVDYDELYVYRTSPYISDTDSDGFDDKTEVYSGNNPNCPEGKNCAAVTGDTAGASTATTDLVGTLSSSGISQEDLTKYDFKNEADVQKFVKSITIDQIRTALANAGVPAEKLAEITDEELQTLFEATVGEAAASGQLSEIVDQMKLSEETETPAP